MKSIYDDEIVCHIRSFIENKGETDVRMENMEIAREVLQQYASILEDWIPKDAAIAIAVGDRYIYYAGRHS